MAATETQAAIVKRPVIEVLQKGKDNLVRRLPSGMDQEKFYLGIMTAIQKNPDLLACDPQSVLLAAYDAAEQGCSLSPSLALGWLIPYKRECVFQSSYRFYVQRAYETGDVRTFFAEVVYRGDRFERQFAPKRNLVHLPSDGERSRENRMGAYALVEFMDGTIEWEYLNSEQIERHRGKSKQPNSMKWTDFWEEGWRITAIRVLAKRLPLKSRKLGELVEAINKNAEKELDTPIDGSIEYSADSPLAKANSKPVDAHQEQIDAEVERQKALGNKAFEGTEVYMAPNNRVGMPVVSYRVGKLFTFINGNVTKLASDLRKLHAEPDGKGWKIPASHTQEFVELAEKRGVAITEIQGVEEQETEAPANVAEVPNPFNQTGERNMSELFTE